MKLGKLSILNFGSYPHFSMDFSNLGLSLLYGNTGSGKSTVMDMSSWVLFGATAKDGSVDDVRSWQTPDEVTSGVQEVELPSGKITITRIRGSTGKNDLYWNEGESDEKKRGKDITETQKLLEQRLGVDADTYIMAAYFHEFSPAGSFFVSKAKDRRALFERIAHLELPKKIADGASEERKAAKASLEAAEKKRARTLGQIEEIENSRRNTADSIISWDEDHAAELVAIQYAADNFVQYQAKTCATIAGALAKWEATKASTIETLVSEIEAIQVIPDAEFDSTIQQAKEMALPAEKHCSKCKQPVRDLEKVKELELIVTTLELRRRDNARSLAKKDLRLEQLRNLNDSINPYEDKLAAAKQQPNICYEQLKTEQARINPHLESIKTLDLNYAAKFVEAESVEASLQSLRSHIAQLTKLYDLSSILRAELLKSAVKSIEEATNKILDTYFDSELSVRFELSGDNLDIDIQKSGYACNFKQLSKGQRGLLKLAFVRSVMKASANRAGIHFDTIFFDESLDGLDESLKVKAFNLFQEIESEHASVLMIDHAQSFQNLFTKKFKVTMTGDVSSMEEENE